MMVSDERPRAGKSAEQVAGRRRAKAQRLQKSAEAFERGAEGEARTADALGALDPSRWTVLHDVPWPGRTYANIDHVVVGPNGVYVIDSKNWSGRLSVTGGVLRQNGYSRQRAVDRAIDASGVVAGLVPEVDRRLVRAVLCFTGDDVPTGELARVALASTSSIAALLERQPVRLTAAQVAEISMRLDLGLVRHPAPAVAAATTQSVSLARRHRGEKRTVKGFVTRLAAVAALMAAVSAIAPHLLQR